jgi:hypothetical protein
VTDVLQIAEKAVGARFRPMGAPEQPTGHMALLESGAVMVLTDGTAGTDYLQFLAVALYASYDAMMQDNDSPLGYADTVAAHAPSEVERVMRDVWPPLRRVK